MVSSCAIVIPVYKEQLSELEEISLNQCYRILDSHNIIFAAPEGFYAEWINNHEIRYFEKKNFVNERAYNNLMLDEIFYESFNDFEYILIYQLDAFVFEDRIKYFCDMGYDYIGAPWIDGQFYFVNPSNSVWHVGNGGLSLRKVNSCYRLLKKQKIRKDLFLSDSEKVLRYIKNEDLFFSSMQVFGFKVAPLDVALRFSFEEQPEKCYELNCRELPFGTHAWGKFNIDFWKPYIESYGYYISDDYVEEGNYCRTSDYIAKRTINKQKNNFWEEIFNIEDVNNYINNLLSFNSDDEKEIVLWGAGKFAESLIRFFKIIGIPISAVIDSDELKNGMIIENVIVKKPEILKKGKTKVIISLKNKEAISEICDYLNSYNFVKNVDYVLMEEIGYFMDYV